MELYEGTMFYLTSGMTKCPFIPGHEWSGEVVEVGENGKPDFAPGDAVVGECSIGCRQCRRCQSGMYHLCEHRSETGLLKQPGAMAEYISYPRFFLHKVGKLPYDQAAFIEPTGVAVHPTRKSKVSPADRVMVMGAGPIGLFMTQIAKAYGAKQIITVDALENRLVVARQLGATDAINCREGNFEEQVLNLTLGEKVDVVLEAVGKKAVWALIASAIAPGARIALTGLFAGEVCEVNFDPLVIGQATIFGCLGAPGMWPECVSLHQRGLIQTDKIITHRMPLSEFGDAIEIARQRKDGVIKIVLKP